MSFPPLTFLVVGDPHIKPDDLAEGESLIKLIEQVAAEQNPTAIVFMGDLFHTHSLVHVEVLHFWRKAIAQLSARQHVYVVLGNHDAPHDMPPGVHALDALRMHNVTVIDSPQVVRWTPATVPMLPDDEAEKNATRVLFVPFMRSSEDFTAACKRSPEAGVVYCHQEFDGARYDNGFYAPHGVKPEDIPQRQVVSGHIHTGQEFDKVWYVGSPRWLTTSDANQDRCIWVVEHGYDGAVVGRSCIPTDSYCQKIVRLEDTPESPVNVASWYANANSRLYVDIRGPAAWVEERKALWKNAPVSLRLRTFVTDGKRTQLVRESEGVPTAFRKYLGTYTPPMGTPKERLEAMIQERLGF